MQKYKRQLTRNTITSHSARRADKAKATDNTLPCLNPARDDGISDRDARVFNAGNNGADSDGYDNSQEDNHVDVGGNDYHDTDSRMLRNHQIYDTVTPDALKITTVET